MTLRRSKEDFEKCLNIQLKRLKTDYIDYYLVHNLTDLNMWKKLKDLGIESWIKEKKKEGKIKHIGFSFHGSQNEFLKILDDYDWEFCMIQYNYMNINYQAGKTGLLAAHKKGISVMIMEPLLGGKLAVNLPKKALNALKKSNDKLSPAGWALKWLWNQTEVTTVLSGMNKLEQLNDNVEVANTSSVNMMSKEEVETINKVIDIFNESYKVNCTGCNYCMPCPKGVNIPAALSSYNAYYVMGKIEGIKQYILSIGITSGTNNCISNCTSCTLCEKNCPQEIEIIKELKKAKKKIEPFWIKWILKTVKRIFK